MDGTGGPLRLVKRIEWGQGVRPKMIFTIFHIITQAIYQAGCGLRVPGCRLRVTRSGLRVAGYVLRVAGYGLRVTGCGLRVSRSGLRDKGFAVKAKVKQG